jgi:hypothetical protein
MVLALLSPAVGTGNVGDHFIELAVRRLLAAGTRYERIGVRRPLGDAELAAVNACDAAVLCGTNLYQHDWESALSEGALERIEVPLVPFGVGGSAADLADTAVGERTAAMIRALHARCPVGGVRDPHALEVVGRLGVSNASLTGCPVLFWAGGDELPLPAARRRRRLVVTARNWLMHRWPDNEDHPVQIDLLRRVVAEAGADEVVYAVHEDFDLRLAERIGVDADRVVASDDPAAYVALYSDPDNVVLASRLHAGMLAVANGVPAVLVGHDTRTSSFCDMLGLEHVELFEDGAADRCLELVRAALAGEPAGLDRAAEAYGGLRGAMGAFMEANGL